MPLFTATDLTNLLHYEVSEASAVIAERVVVGWLKAAGVDVTVDPVPEEVFSWAVELGAIAHENPSGLSESELGDARDVFSAERRREILADAAAAPASSGLGRPQGSFPSAACWPDPAERYGPYRL